MSMPSNSQISGSDVLLSVIICTRNPRAEYFQRTLGGLAAQDCDRPRWELLIIDNGSTPPLAGPFAGLQDAGVRVIREEETGLTPARLCGIRHATGDLLLFVDDDNVLEPSYLTEALRISAAHPELGAWGGSSIPEFEVPPPADIVPQLGGLALGVVDEAVFSTLAEVGPATPFGAGMCVRREVASHYLKMAGSDPLRKSLDRSGKSFGAGGDTDMAFCACDLGLATGRFPSLRLTHLIPKERLNVDYIERIFEGFGFARVVMPFIRNRKVEGQVPGLLRFLRTRIRWSLARLTGDSQTRIRTRGHLGELKGRKTLFRLMQPAADLQNS
jgi:glycosyltransferase involved in cell wall biosynthesis